LAPIDDPDEARLEHELIDHVFEAYDPATASFVPVQQLSYWYPSDQPHAARPPAGVSAVVSTMAAFEGMLAAETLDSHRAGLLPHALQLLRAAPMQADADTAARAAEALFAAHPSAEVAKLVARAASHLDRDELPAARDALDAALALDADHAHAHARRAALHLREGAHAAALADANRAIQLEPCHLNALRVRAGALREAQDLPAARAAYLELLDLHPWSPASTELHHVEQALEARSTGRWRQRRTRRGGRSSTRFAR